MADSDVERLSRVEAVDERRAKQALSLGDGDFDKARHIIRQAPAALKFRFASQEEDVYGLGVLVLSVSPPGLDDITTVVGNERSLGTVTLSQGLDELKQVIAERANSPSAMAALGRRLGDDLKQSLTPPPEDWISLVKARNEADLQTKLRDLVKNILEEGELVLTAELDAGVLDVELDEDKPSTEEESTDSSSSNSSPGTDYKGDEVELLCDVKVSPVTGRAVQNLRPGDEIYVDVKESQKDDYRPLLEVIERLRHEESGLIPVIVDSINRTESGKVEITVQFGENVLGKTIAGEDMNILTPESLRIDSERFSELLSILPWLLIGAGLLMIGFLILYALFWIP